jgi:DNA polymerase-3 subunit epsilon
MRQVVLDTETTGLAIEKGHRLIEVGCVELVGRRPTGRTFHRYVNPQRASDQGALEVHGITDEFLRDKPLFAEIAPELIEFLRGAELVIHNADFDLAFLDHELSLLGTGDRIRDHATVLDTLRVARERFPGQRNSLDALCKRLNVDASHRTLHGALLDAELLAEVYLAMTAGQATLEFGLDAGPTARADARREILIVLPRLRVVRASEDDVAAHERRLEGLAKTSKGTPLWHLLDAPARMEATA